MDSTNLLRDHYYIIIEVEDNLVILRPTRIDNFGKLDMIFKNDTFEYEIICKNHEAATHKMKDQIMEYFNSVGEEIFNYYRLDLYRKKIIMLQSHTSELGCEASIVEILLALEEAKVIDIEDVGRINRKDKLAPSK